MAATTRARVRRKGRRSCSGGDPRIPPRARCTDLQESFLRLKNTVLPVTKNAKPVGVMNGGDSGTVGERCRRLRGETDPRRRVGIVNQARSEERRVGKEARSQWARRRENNESTE